MSWNPRTPQLRHRAPAEPVGHDDQRRPARIVDRLTAVFGSRGFVVAQSTLVVLWLGYDGWAATRWFAGGDVDPFPFILLNLLFLTQAACAASLILLSRNRTTQRDRAEHDVDVDVLALRALAELLGDVHDVTHRRYLVARIAELLGDEPVPAPASVTDRPHRNIYVHCAPGRSPGAAGADQLGPLRRRSDPVRRGEDAVVVDLRRP